MFFNQYPYFAASNGGQNMTKSKQEKAAGREKHQQIVRAKKMQAKERKQAALPTRHKKNK
jgi:hypothetical protein